MVYSGYFSGIWGKIEPLCLPDKTDWQGSIFHDSRCSWEVKCGRELELKVPWTTSVECWCSCLHTIGRLSPVLPVVRSSLVDMEAVPESTCLWGRMFTALCATAWWSSCVPQYVLFHLVKENDLSSTGSESTANSYSMLVPTVPAHTERWHFKNPSTLRWNIYE